MPQEDTYTTKKQLKAITSHGRQYRSTISGNVWDEGVFPQPVYTPEAKKAIRKTEAKGPDWIENMTISIDLDVKESGSDEGFLRMLKAITSFMTVEKNFEVLSTAEKVIRALAKAKFRNVASIVLDDEELYRQPEDFFDYESAIRRLIEEIHKRSGEGTGNMIRMELLSNDHKNCRVETRISRVHAKWIHDILITFHGALPEEYFRRVINYLEEHLAIEDMENKWRNA